jgi:cytochrome c biogenesis factor
MSLVLDVSTKPLIGLIWLGTVLTVVGICMALSVRGRDVNSIG